MAERKWVDQENYVPVEGDKMSTETLTEQAGYIPANIQVERLILAGQRLDAFNKAMYDFEDEDQSVWDFNDPTRDPNYDMADASQSLQDLAARYKKAEKEAKEKSTPPVSAGGIPALEGSKTVPPTNEK
jgi:hypothetical protein